MAVWSGLGINYGEGSLSAAQIEADLSFIRLFFNKIRITYPPYNSVNMAYWKDVVVRAKNHGFYVMWGITTPSDFTAQQWTDYKAEWLTIATWAATNSVDEFGMNEEDFHNDPGNVATATVQSEARTTATTAKAANPSLTLVYSFAAAQLSDWAASGKGSFDKVGMNQYDTETTFKANLTTLNNAFGTDARLSEFADQMGFGSLSEDDYDRRISARVRIAQASGIPHAYFYTYKGLLPWDIKQSSGFYHIAWFSLAGGRRSLTV
jgi:hypothetical protein